MQRSSGRKEHGVLNTVKEKLAVGLRSSHRFVSEGKVAQDNLER